MSEVFEEVYLLFSKVIKLFFAIDSLSFEITAKHALLRIVF